jgi:hypothetical protein
MSWNIFKRVGELERWVRDLNDFHFGNSRRIKAVEDELSRLEQANQLLVNSNQALIRKQENISERVKDLSHQIYKQSRQASPYAAAPVRSEGQPVFTNDEVDKAREIKRKYQREWYAKRQAKKNEEKIAKLAREKKNAYARAYYKRKKEKSNEQTTSTTA